AALSDMAPPLLTAFAANRVGEDLQGLVQGVIASLSSVAAVIAPLVFTGAFERFVSDGGLYLPGAPFILAALLIVATVPLILRLRGADPKRDG
ncbi:MAG: MFS transporter, partial [Rhodobacteraceae bacterium]|nr:MFS transporter [Paracoccaceae bacterium]